MLSVANISIKEKSITKSKELEAIYKSVKTHLGTDIYTVLPSGSWHEVSFELKNTYAGLANAFRRVLIEELPVICATADEKAITSDDEFVKGLMDVLIKNINLLPVRQDLDVNEMTNKKLAISLDVFNNTNEVIDVTARDFKITKLNSKVTDAAKKRPTSHATAHSNTRTTAHATAHPNTRPKANTSHTTHDRKSNRRDNKVKGSADNDLVDSNADVVDVVNNNANGIGDVVNSAVDDDSDNEVAYNTADSKIDDTDDGVADEVANNKADDEVANSLDDDEVANSLDDDAVLNTASNTTSNTASTTTNKQHSTYDIESIFPNPNITIIRLRPMKYITIDNLSFETGVGHDNFAKFSLLNNVSYEPLDIIPFDIYTGSGTRSAEHDCKEFKISFTTAGNIMPKHVMKLAINHMKKELASITKHIEDFDIVLKADPTKKYYETKDLTVTNVEEIFQYNFINQYFTMMSMICQRCFILDKNVLHCSTGVYRYDTKIGIIKIKHSNCNKLILASIEECMKDLDIVSAAFKL